MALASARMGAIWRIRAAVRLTPAQHMAPEWVCTRFLPRNSQMPASGSSARAAHWRAIFSSTWNSDSSPGTGRRLSKNMGVAASTTLP